MYMYLHALHGNFSANYLCKVATNEHPYRYHNRLYHELITVECRVSIEFYEIALHVAW